MQNFLNQILKPLNLIFWDFDGVIKDSVIAKGYAFEYLFSDCDEEVLSQIREHHLKFGGVSRFKKIPMYLNFAGIPSSNLIIKKYSEKFSSIVKDLVIESPWVPGVFEYLESNYSRQQFILVTATPKIEIDEILMELNISDFFREVYGYSISKANGIALGIEMFKFELNKTIMIGDSLSDFNAAIDNNVPFLLRQTSSNIDLQNDLNCLMFKDFING
jgi:phosphoglycolate phosphatase-like HAD superfamily hydrolase